MRTSTSEFQPRTPSGRGLLARFRRNQRGVSAVEFALLLPLMLTIYIGGAELGQAISIYRKVGQTAFSLADLVSQVSNLTTSDMNNVLAAATAVMSPYPTSGTTMIVSSLCYSSAGKLTVDWSVANSGLAWTAGAAPPSTVSVPNNILVKGTNTIVAYVTYTYDTGFAPFLKDATGSTLINLSDVAYLRPRMSSFISYNSVTNCS
ncbi:MAG: pilus assembly protein [Ancalomicrobiaceae bacterium]|nr:pilus assembly protein [Ancalomicrobiaceae bacterium]